jgi:thymidine kinase
MEVHNSSYLEINVGPMFSGKTSKLIEIYKKYSYCNIKVLPINHILDNRYSDTMLSSHNKDMIPCVKSSLLFDIDENVLETCQVILINEGQFFPDLIDFVKLMLQNKKKIYVFGLDGDFNRNRFGAILDLIPLCDNVYKLHSLCGLCKTGKKGIFSKRVTTEKSQVLIGSDNYIPCCRECYEKCD